MADVIPVFPLTHVLLPSMPLPLHIFEERYRQLLRDVRADGKPGAFGVLALRRGVEAGTTHTRDDLVDIGTLAEIVEVAPYDDGASDVLAVGSRRFRVLELTMNAAPYICARVEWLPEVTGDLHPAHIGLARQLCGDLHALLAALTGRERTDDLPHDATMLSYHVAGQLPLDSEDRQALLGDATDAERLVRAISLLQREIRLVQSTRSIAIAPSVLQLAPHTN